MTSVAAVVPVATAVGMAAPTAPAREERRPPGRLGLELGRGEPDARRQLGDDPPGEVLEPAAPLVASREDRGREPL